MCGVIVTPLANMAITELFSNTEELSRVMRGVTVTPRGRYGNYIYFFLKNLKLQKIRWI
jgi:hypothetical protein